MSLKLTFHVAFESDYHVGAGHGLGTEIDSALLRSADGVPVLRGTLLNGLLRDGFTRLLDQDSMQHWRDKHPCQAGGAVSTPNRYCGQYQAGELNLLDICPVCRLFGSPRLTKRWSISSARPRQQRRIKAKPVGSGEINSQRVMRARVSPRTRRAEPRKLFSQEHGGQQVFEFVATCPTDDEAALDEAAILVAAARMVRQLGSGRRRGLGECLIRLKSINGQELVEERDVQAYLLDRFCTKWLMRTEPLGEPASATEPASWLKDPRAEDQEEAQSEAVRVRLIARAHEPVLIAQRASAGNQFETQPVITGKTLRGALAAIAARKFDLTHSPTRAAFVDLFLRGGVRFPMLLPMRFEPAMGEIYPAIPVPRDGYKCKVYPGHRIQWDTKDGANGHDPGESCGTQTGGTEICGEPVKAVRGKFIGFSHDEEEPFEPERRNEMHIQIDRRTGRVTEGQVFEYVALEAGQYFCGELRCKDAAAWEELQAFLGLDVKEGKRDVIQIRLGKGRRRGYGRTSLWLKEVKDEPPLWIWRPIEERVKPDAKELTLTLLTDTIVTDERGRFVTGFEASWLREVLKPDVTLAAEEKDTPADQRAYAATRPVDGFNTVKQLPRWRSVALAAGSTVRLAIGARPAGDLHRALSEIEHDGIGLRRNEGYGQVAFNHPVYKGPVQGAKVLVNRLPQELQPGIGKPRSRSQFVREWEVRLRRADWSVCARPPLTGTFAALARWLVAEQNQQPADLIKVLDVLLAKTKEAQEEAQQAIPEALAKTLSALGEPDQTLKEELIDDYGSRDKANKLLRSEARPGVELIRTHLKELTVRPAEFWSDGVALIAAQVSEVTKNKEEV